MHGYYRTPLFLILELMRLVEMKPRFALSKNCLNKSVEMMIMNHNQLFISINILNHNQLLISINILNHNQLLISINILYHIYKYSLS